MWHPAKGELTGGAWPRSFASWSDVNHNEPPVVAAPGQIPQSGQCSCSTLQFNEKDCGMFDRRSAAVDSHAA